MSGETIRDKFKELKTKANDLARKKNVYEGKLEEKRKARQECVEELQELGIKDPTEKSIKAFIEKKKKDLVSKIKKKLREVNDAHSRLEECAG